MCQNWIRMYWFCCDSLVEAQKSAQKYITTNWVLKMKCKKNVCKKIGSKGNKGKKNMKIEEI